MPLTHVPPEQQLPLPQVPFPAAPQADVHVPKLHVGDPPEQAVQVPPDAPQTALAVPATQTPAEQQPPLQAVCDGSPQKASHWRMARLQLSPVGQSAARLQANGQAPDVSTTRGPSVESPAVPSPAPFRAVTRYQNISPGRGVPVKVAPVSATE